LTALNSLADTKLSEFADGYPAYLQSWQGAISAWLHNGRTGHGHGHAH
jgi:hypothetical protein